MNNNLRVYLIVIFIGFTDIPCSSTAPRPDLGERINGMYERTCGCTTRYPRATALFILLTGASFIPCAWGLVSGNSRMFFFSLLGVIPSMAGLTCTVLAQSDESP